MSEKTTFMSASGLVWDAAKPTPEMINWIDIAESLAKQCRFNGHCKEFYSVAQHSVLVANAVPSPYHLYGLLHDAHEAFIGDITRPVKNLIGRNYIKDIEQKIDHAIYKAAGVEAPSDAIHALIKEADNRVLATEKRDLVTRPTPDGRWRSEYLPLDEQIRPLPWRVAKEMFANELHWALSRLRTARRVGDR